MQALFDRTGLDYLYKNFFLCCIRDEVIVSPVTYVL